MIFVVVVTTGDYPDDRMTYNAYVGTDPNKADDVAKGEDNFKRGTGNSLIGIEIQIWNKTGLIKEIDYVY